MAATSGTQSARARGGAAAADQRDDARAAALLVRDPAGADHVEEWFSSFSAKARLKEDAETLKWFDDKKLERDEKVDDDVHSTMQDVCAEQDLAV